MKKFRYLLWVVLFIGIGVTGCQEKKDDSVPLISDTVVDDGLIPEEVKIEGALKDIEFSLQGTSMKLPLLYEDAIQAGWIFKGDETKIVDSHSYLQEERFEVEGYGVTVEITNFSSEKLPINQCSIGAVVIDMNEVKDAAKALKVVLPDGIHILESTIVQAEEVYGTPTDKYEGDDKLMLTYEFGVNKRVILTFASQSEILTRVELYNRQNPNEEISDKKVSKKPTVAVKQYQQPQEIPEDFMEFVVSYGGVLYQLSAPVTAFTDNGWAIQEDKSDLAIKPGEFGNVTLSLGNQNLYAVAYNNDDQPAAVKNCFLTTVYADLSVTKVPLTISKGITMGMNQVDFELAIAGITSEKDEDLEAGTVTYYIYQDQDKMNYTSITIDTALQLVSAIKVVHYPEGSTPNQESIMNNIEDEERSSI